MALTPMATTIRRVGCRAITSVPRRSTNRVSRASWLRDSWRSAWVNRGYLARDEDVDPCDGFNHVARAVEIDANHYGVVMHEETGRQIAGFLS